MEPQDNCVICLTPLSESIKKGKEITTTKCNHSFCEDCLNTWLKRERSCPTCRAKIKDFEFSEDCPDPKMDKALNLIVAIILLCLVFGFWVYLDFSSIKTVFLIFGNILNDTACLVIQIPGIA